jgi:hypothetical protein
MTWLATERGFPVCASTSSSSSSTPTVRMPAVCPSSSTSSRPAHRSNYEDPRAKGRRAAWSVDERNDLAGCSLGLNDLGSRDSRD